MNKKDGWVWWEGPALVLCIVIALFFFRVMWGVWGYAIDSQLQGKYIGECHEDKSGNGKFYCALARN